MADFNIEKLFDNLSKKKIFDKKNSYTSSLLTNKNLLAKKIGEESIEVILEYFDDNKDNIIKESADLLYHLCVMWISADIKPAYVWSELHRRKGISGFDEKKRRLS